MLSAGTTAEVASTLRSLPTGKYEGPCTLMANARSTSYLLGFTAGEKVWWVAASTDVNRCATPELEGATIRAYVGDAFAKLADKGTWKPELITVLQ